MKDVRLLDENSRKSSFLAGLKDAVPIGLGYFAVSFSLGITARGAGAASDFGFEIVTLLKGEQTAAELKKQMQY